MVLENPLSCYSESLDGSTIMVLGVQCTMRELSLHADGLASMSATAWDSKRKCCSWTKRCPSRSSSRLRHWHAVCVLVGRSRRTIPFPSGRHEISCDVPLSRKMNIVPGTRRCASYGFSDRRTFSKPYPKTIYYIVFEYSCSTRTEYLPVHGIW